VKVRRGKRGGNQTIDLKRESHLLGIHMGSWKNTARTGDSIKWGGQRRGGTGYVRGGKEREKARFIVLGTIGRLQPYHALGRSSGSGLKAVFETSKKRGGLWPIWCPHPEI